MTRKNPITISFTIHQPPSDFIPFDPARSRQTTHMPRGIVVAEVGRRFRPGEF